MRKIKITMELELKDLHQDERDEIADGIDCLRDDGTYQGRPVPDPEDPDNEYSDIGGPPEDTVPKLGDYTAQEIAGFFEHNLVDALSSVDGQHLLFDGSDTYFAVNDGRVLSVEEIKE